MAPELVVQGVSKRFGPAQALENVSFTVEGPDLLVVLGANGAGKTTLLRILAGYLSPDEGRVELAGHAIDVDSPGARRLIGYLPESVALYPEMDVRGFLAFMAEARGVPRERVTPRVDEAVETMRLAAVTRQRLGTLSRGYRQRVGIAQALVHDPPVLLLDEPTSALDPEQIQDARETLRRLACDRVVVVSTHLLPEAAKMATQVVIIDEGQVAACGRHDELGGPDASVHAVLRGPRPAVSASVHAKASGWRLVPGDGDVCVLEVAGTLPEEVARWVVGNGWDLTHLSVPGTGLEDAYMAVISRSRRARG